MDKNERQYEYKPRWKEVLIVGGFRIVYSPGPKFRAAWRARKNHMKLGLITDSHEHVEHLRTALDRFRNATVDQVVVIGDVFEMGQRIKETCRLLSEAHAVGVWGNHDFGLCFDPLVARHARIHCQLERRQPDSP